MKNAIYYVCSFFAICAIFSCTKDIEEVYTGDYTTEDFQKLSEVLNLPSEVVDYNAKPNVNPFVPAAFHNNEQATLGRVLFYDKTLSNAGEISCASCHKQELAFADDVAFSEGVRGELTLRNSIALGQFASFGSEYDGSGSFGNPQPLFWDGRAFSVHEQLLETMSNPIEMDIDINELAARLESQDHYKVLFKRAFGSEQIENDKILIALEAFMNTMEGSNSAFDQGFVQQGDIFGEFDNLSASENRGKDIFFNHSCGSCHSSALVGFFDPGFSDNSFANNGLQQNYEDAGLGVHTNLAVDMAKFKIPQLRNIAQTGPYMHDGRFETLEEVVDFYSTDIAAHPNLDSRLKDGNSPMKFNFTAQEKSDLVNFLKTMSDDFLLTDSRWSDPF